jgi:predicted ArsR family transcriptional regulator
LTAFAFSIYAFLLVEIVSRAKRKNVHDRKMAPKLSLTPQQLEIACETYHQLLELAAAVEAVQGKVPSLAEKLATGRLEQLLRIRIFLQSIINRRRGVTAHDLGQKLGKIGERRIQRHLDRLRQSQILVRRPGEKGKGRWSKPGSRPESEGGRPPYKYALNPFIAQEYMTSDYVDEEMRRSLYLAQKSLSRTHIFMEATARMIEVYQKIVPQLPAFANAARKIPEIDELVRKLGYETPPPGLEKFIAMIPEESASHAILRWQIPFSQEDLPKQEAWRLGVLLGL